MKINSPVSSRLINGLCGHSCQRATTSRREILSKPSVIPFKFAVDEQDWLENKAAKNIFLSINEYVLWGLISIIVRPKGKGYTSLQKHQGEAI